MQQVLRESLLPLVDDGISDVVFLIGVEGGRYTFLWVNRRFLEAVGMEAGQIIGRPVDEVIPPPARDLVLSRYDQAIREGRRVTWEEVSEYPAGTKVGRVAVEPVLDDEGRCTHLLGTVRDLTDQSRMEAEAERYRRLLLDTGRMARVGGWEVDIEAGRVIWTAVTREIHAVDDDYEPTLDSALDFFPGAARSRLERAIRRAMRKGEPYDMELPFINAAGQELWVHTRCEPELENGACVRLRGTFQDLTPMKERERELTAKKKMLTRTERLAGIGSWEWEPDSGLVEWSDGLFPILGLDHAGEPVPWEAQGAYYVAGDHERLVDAVEACLRDGTPYHLEVDVVRPDGEVRHCVARGQREDTAGGSLRLVGTLEDVTDRKRAELEREHLREQLHQAQKLETVGRLAGGVAHDFNNILTAIDGNVSLLRDALPEGTPLEEDIDRVLDASQRAADLTKQLLAFSRRQVLELRNVDAAALIRDLERLLKRLVPERIDFSVSVGSGAAVVRADPAQLQQVIMNLVVNARDAIEGRGTIAIRLDTSEVTAGDETGVEGTLRPGRFAAITVVDSGCGIAAADLDRIFEPFFTTKPPGEGTGLGLATAYGIVRQAGGDMTVDSQVGSGSTFRVFLPLIDAEPDTPDPGGAGETPADSGHHAGKSILIVEDDASVRRVIRRVVEKHGYRAHEACNGREALAFLDSGEAPVDLVISDVVMPEVGGIELGAQLRTRYPGLPLILTSGYSEADFSGEVRSLQAVMLKKPYSPAKLLRTLDRAFRSP